jgi:LytS/YehU family sensor histidine kinase
MLEAQLQVMRAQIEPHFLFNTLANVKRLCQTDVSGGLVMLENLVRYLRALRPNNRRRWLRRVGALRTDVGYGSFHRWFDLGR